MNTSKQYRALVVDDELMVRQATMRALSRASFRCESAADGAMAREMAGQGRYDVVVTDLRMPGSNGHQLAVDLLALPNRPAVVILTGVMEPKLANDLKIRGVDEIFFKPVNYDVFAKQVSAVVNRRAPEVGSDSSHSENNAGPSESSTADHENPSPAHSPVAPQLAKAAATLRHPPTDFDGFSKASFNAVRARDLGQAIELDPSLAPEVLAFANRLLYGSNRALVELERSVAALQQRKAVQAIIIFMAGAFVGWLVSWLIPLVSMM
jgi:DNA-binding NarL/FixJ family response regulator